MNPNENPYASPALVAPSTPPSGSLTEAEQIRRKYLKHEASIQSVGLLYYIGGALMILVMISTVPLLVRPPRDNAPAVAVVALVVLLIYGGLGTLFLVLGRGLRTLDARVKIPVIVLSAIGLLGIPVGTLINGYILYLMLSSKGAMVFSPHYAEIRRQTPHIKYRTSLLVKIFAGILLAVIMLGLIAALFAGQRAAGR